MTQEPQDICPAAFRGGWIFFVPDADPAKHRAVIDTGKYVATIVCVRDSDQAVEVSKALVQDEGVRSISLCPAFSHEDVARVAAAVKGTPINICRSDAAGFMKEFQEIKKAGWF